MFFNDNGDEYERSIKKGEWKEEVSKMMSRAEKIQMEISLKSFLTNIVVCSLKNLRFLYDNILKLETA